MLDKYNRTRQTLAKKNQVFFLQISICIQHPFLTFLEIHDTINSVCYIPSLLRLNFSFMFVFKDVTGVLRKIDDIPTRTELIQYERRFVELYEQVKFRISCNCKVEKVIIIVVVVLQLYEKKSLCKSCLYTKYKQINIWAFFFFFFDCIICKIKIKNHRLQQSSKKLENTFLLTTHWRNLGSI